MLIALPLLVIPVILYNIVVLSGLGGGGLAAADEAWRPSLFSIPSSMTKEEFRCG